MQKTQSGLTLLEAILSVVIGAAMIVLSIQQYHQWSIGSSQAQLKLNVDSLFEAAAYLGPLSRSVYFLTQSSLEGQKSPACPGYVIDHVHPLKRGGADSASNMQWQTLAEAKGKDRTE